MDLEKNRPEWGKPDLERQTWYQIWYVFPYLELEDQAEEGLELEDQMESEGPGKDYG